MNLSRSPAIAGLVIYSIIVTFALALFVVKDVAVKLDAAVREDLYQTAIKKEPATFPIKLHLVTHGHPRTASTLLFNMVSVSYFLSLLKNRPGEASRLVLEMRKREGGGIYLQRFVNPHVVKTHLDLDEFKGDNITIFATAMNKYEASEIESKLSSDGHTVAFVQDMETLKEIGINGLVQTYVAGFGLSSEDEKNLLDYFSSWEILRQCCGKQMSQRWRNDLFPDELKRRGIEHHPSCSTYDIDYVERQFMNTSLFSLLEDYPNMLKMNRPSFLDDSLNGTYCSQYNQLVHEKGLNFWGYQGRATRSTIDRKIREQFSLDNSHLSPEGMSLLNTTYRRVWRLPKEEKKAWLEKILAVRGSSQTGDSKRYHTNELGHDSDDDEKDEVNINTGEGSNSLPLVVDIASRRN